MQTKKTFSSIKKEITRSISVSLMIMIYIITQAPISNAYPIFAQQGYENPREATGRIVCANCHLANKPVEYWKKRTFEGCDQELLNIIENRRSEDLVEDKVKSEPTLGSGHSRSEPLLIRSWIVCLSVGAMPPNSMVLHKQSFVLHHLGLGRRRKVSFSRRPFCPKKTDSKGLENFPRCPSFSRS